MIFNNIYPVGAPMTVHEHEFIESWRVQCATNEEGRAQYATDEEGKWGVPPWPRLRSTA